MRNYTNLILIVSLILFILSIGLNVLYNFNNNYTDLIKLKILEFLILLNFVNLFNCVFIMKKGELWKGIVFILINIISFIYFINYMMIGE